MSCFARRALGGARLAIVTGFVAATAIASANASDHKIALVPGGPHPYFAPWEQAAADAKKDFGIAVVEAGNLSKTIEHEMNAGSVAGLGEESLDLIGAPQRGHIGV